MIDVVLDECAKASCYWRRPMRCGKLKMKSTSRLSYSIISQGEISNGAVRSDGSGYQSEMWTTRLTD
jgi:hypothetical protein